MARAPSAWRRRRRAPRLTPSTFAPGCHRSCVPCFPSFDVDPPPAALSKELANELGLVPEMVLSSTAPLRDGCTCVGFFPRPEHVCLEEGQRGSHGEARDLSNGSDLAWQERMHVFRSFLLAIVLRRGRTNVVTAGRAHISRNAQFMCFQHRAAEWLALDSAAVVHHGAGLD
mgnify:CR=1 FL=1